ncbi:MAG TPA: hypothetical protein VH139_11960 [Acidobacteriaceae bacterium]|nr:hypothetical protein [Acidobacteriaceae bacterium]
MQYREVQERDRQQIELMLRSPDKMDRLDALLSATYYDPDWRWVQGRCLDFLSHVDFQERGLAATCLGHLARIHKQLDIELVLSRLAPLKNDPLVGSYVQDALDDIRFFLKFQLLAFGHLNRTIPFSSGRVCIC